MEQVDQEAARARHLLTIGRHDEALAAVSRALAAAPQDDELHVLAGRIHLAAGAATEAEAAGRRALTLRLSVPALHVTAIATRLLGRRDEALALFERTVAMQPEASTLHVGLALTLLLHGTSSTADDVTRARAEARRAAELDADAAQPHYVLALCAVAQDDLPTAGDHLTEALARDPAWIEAHLLLGNVRASQGMSRLASRHYAAAGHTAPTRPEPLQHLRSLAGRRVLPEAERILAADQRLRQTTG